MENQRPTSAPAACDIAAAWLLCVMIAALALGLMSTLHGSMPPAATVAAAASPCPSAPGSMCQLSPDAAGQRVGATAGLHRLTPSITRSLDMARTFVDCRPPQSTHPAAGAAG